MKKTGLLVLAVLALVSAPAMAAVTSTFDVNNEGWFGDGATAPHQATAGADGDPGWVALTATATGFPSLRNNTTHVGNLAALHGEGLSEVVLSFDIKVEGAAAAAAYTSSQFRIFGMATTGMWLKTVGPGPLLPGEWLNVDEPIDTDWTDAEANANGWTLNSGPHSFSTIMNNVSLFVLSHNNIFTTGSVIGYDNIGINAIPEPASLALLGLGGLMMFRRRRA